MEETKDTKEVSQRGSDAVHARGGKTQSLPIFIKRGVSETVPFPLTPPLCVQE